MSLHIVKLCVGCDSPTSIKATYAKRREADGQGNYVVKHRTRMFPRRADEIAGKGSLYWVIKGVILVRLPILRFERVTGEDGINYCDIVMDVDRFTRTMPQPKRAFQGWRYFKAEDAPADDPTDGAIDNVPVEMRAELMSLGLI